MGKISDIWVRLGLKKDGFDRGLDNAKKNVGGFADSLGKMKTGALAVWALVGAGVMKFAKDFRDATNKIGDAWGHTMASVKAGWQTVLSEMANTGLGSTEGSGSKIGNWFKNEAAWWKQLFSRTKEAATAAKDASEAFDAEFELTNSVKIQRAQVQQELNKLYTDIRDTTISPYMREDAMKKYKGILQPIVQAEIDAYKVMLDEAVKAWQAGTGLSRGYSTSEVVDFFAMYGTDPNKAKSKYGELWSVYENRKGDKTNQVIVDYILKLQDAENEISNLDREMARAAISIKKSKETMFDIGSDSPDVWAKKTAKDVKDSMKELLESQKDSLEDFTPYDPLEHLFDIDMESAEQDLEAWNQKFLDEVEKAKGYGQMLEDALISSMGNGLQAITDMMMGIQGADAKSVLAAFIAPFGDMAKNMGAMIMSYGISMEAFKKAFTNPYVAIAAGAGLMAIGAAISSGAQKLSQGSLSGGASTAYTGGSPSGADVASYESTLTVEVVGKLSGSDILLAGQKTQNKWNR